MGRLEGTMGVLGLQNGGGIWGSDRVVGSDTTFFGAKRKTRNFTRASNSKLWYSMALKTHMPRDGKLQRANNKRYPAPPQLRKRSSRVSCKGKARTGL
jgi:hypothetical protein